MTESSEFAEALQTWSRTFMRQSIHDMIHFSRGTGLSMPQVSTLFHLHHANECGVSNIGEHLGVTNAAASQMIDRLVQQGLIERTEDPHDRRVKQLKLTAKGVSIVRRGAEVRSRRIDSLNDALTSDEQTLIIKALNMLTATAQKLEAVHHHSKYK